MGRLWNIVKWGTTLGTEPQSFLGAKWIRIFLAKVSDRKKRLWALRILNLSPHYFISPDADEYRNLSNDDYLEAAFNAVTESRVDIYRILLKTHLNKDHQILDYGCGPGFLAKAVSSGVKKIFAVDISAGAIECARILNPAENINYLIANEEGLRTIPDGSCDVVYSYAVLQHLTDDVLDKVLENCRAKLKVNGNLLLHIQLRDDVWQTEEHWINYTSTRGKIKYRCGLHCFGRAEEVYSEFVIKHGFGELQIIGIEGFAAKYDEELKSQRLLIARKIS